jgi:hypothetical protein
MKLEMWVKLQQIEINVFAKKIGKSRSLVHKYIYEGVIPKHEVMVKIYRETLGSVSANDFHRLSDQIFEQDFQKNSLVKEVLHANSFR